jgi:hypothetical protein
LWAAGLGYRRGALRIKVAMPCRNLAKNPVSKKVDILVDFSQRS